MNKAKLDIAIYISALLLAAGVFLPLTQLPVYGEVSYHDVANVEAYLVIAFALAGPVLLFIGKLKMLWISVAGVWGTLLFPALKSMLPQEDKGLIGRIGDKAASVLQDFAADLFLNVFEFSWGGYVFLLGLLVYTVAGIMRGLK